MRRPSIPLLLLLAVLAPAAAALAPPMGAETMASQGFRLAYWPGSAEQVDTEAVPAGGSGSLWFALLAEASKNASADANGTVNASTNATPSFAILNLTSESLAFENATQTIELPADPEAWAFASSAFTLAANATGQATYRFSVEVFNRTENGTVLLASTAGGAAITVAPLPPVEPGIPTSWIVGGGAAVVVGASAAFLALRRKRERELMNAAPRRSQVMREMELERQLEKVEEKEPERAQEIKQEIRAQEQVREKRRELQILEAKRADALRTMDLLRKRHEAGALSKHQYDNMVAKKQADLERIEADIAEMEAQDAGGGAAA